MSSNLAISLVIGASVGAAVSGINQIKNSLKALTDGSKSWSDRMNDLSKLSIAGMKSSIGGLTAIGSSLVALSKPAIEFESAMADVKKVVDFSTPDGFKNLSKDLLELTDTIPMTAKELAAITASGGQLGVAETDLKDFTLTIAKMSVAFDMSAEQSGDAMAKLANVYKIPIGEISKLGDAINELSNSSPAKASDIVNTLGRIGGTAKQFGLTENAAAALSNTFISLGKTPEVAGTAINGMLTKLMTAEKGGQAFQKALEEMGINAKQLKRDIAENGEQALVDFMRRVEKLPKDQTMGILVDLFGREYADDVAVLAGNVDLLDKSLNQLKETDEQGNLRYLGSMDKEFAARAETTANSLQVLQNSIVKLGINIGNYVLPIINDFVSGIQPLIISISTWITENDTLMKELVSVASYVLMGIAGFSAMTGVLSLLTFATLKVVGAVSLVWKIFRVAYSIVAVFTNGIFKLIHWLGLLIGYVIKFALVVGGTLVKALMLAGKAVLFIGRALLTTPIGLLITAIALAAYAIYRYWEPIKGFFTHLWGNIKSIFIAFWQFVSNIWNGIVGIWAAIWNGVSAYFLGVWESIKSLFSGNFSALGDIILAFNPLSLFTSIFASVMSYFGIDLPASFTDFGKNIIDGLVNGISNAWSTAKEKVSELGNGIKNWFKEKLGIHSPSRVFMGFGENTVQGLAIGISQQAGLATGAVSKIGEQMQNAFAIFPHINYLHANLQPSEKTQQYASLRQSYQQRLSAQQSTAGMNGINIHFNPTIHVNGNQAKEGVLNEIKQGLNLSLSEFESLLNRVLDQRARRAY